jgi:circadian clock protein KaiC
MPEEQALILNMHELFQYLNGNGVESFVKVAQHCLVGDMKTPVDVTYIADNVILLRFFEAEGSTGNFCRKEAKRRASGHDS